MKYTTCRPTIFVLAGWILVHITISSAIGAEATRPKPKNTCQLAFTKTHQDTLQFVLLSNELKNLTTDLGGVRVSNLIETADGIFIEITRTGDVSTFYDSESIELFLDTYPRLAQQIGLRLVNKVRGRVRVSSRTKTVTYSVAAPDTLNARVNTLRETGLLPNNGLKAVYAKGRLSEREYLKWVSERKIPIAVSDLLFHDINVHLLPLLYFPNAYLSLAQFDIQTILSVGQNASADLRNALISKLSQDIDYATASGFAPKLEELCSERTRSIRGFLKYQAGARLLPADRARLEELVLRYESLIGNAKRDQHLIEELQVAGEKASNTL